jgi:pimeloyl-ACP methyl ester carboxylesterase
MTRSATLRDGTITVDGVELFVRARGDGFPLLLINGLGSNAEMWGAVEEQLSRVTRTIVFDMPGSGRSPTARRAVAIPGLAALAGSVLDYLGVERADVLGFSLGGIVAQQLAHDAPAKIRRLALAGTACGWGGMPPTYEALALLSMPLRYRSRPLYDLTNRLLGAADRDLLARVSRLSDARLRYPPTLLGYAFQLTAGALWSSLPWLASVETATLVLGGEDDQIVPAANAVQLARLLPTSRLQLVPAGHLMLFDPDGPALALLESFFGSPVLEEAEAWQTGVVVAEDETVDSAFATAVGAFPHRLLNEGFRKVIARQGHSQHGASG